MASTQSTTTATTATGDDHSFSLGQDTWESYLVYRPPYPESTWKLWLDYHRGPLNAIHDLGTGCGVGAAGFLDAARAAHGGKQPVRRAFFSDPNASNVATTRELVTRAAPVRYPGVEFAFHQQPGEASFLPEGSLDLVMACECLHWTEIDECVASVHASLRPGGTFAAVLYDPGFATVAGNPAATAAFEAVYEDKIAGLIQGRHRMNITGLDSGNVNSKKRPYNALNFVPLEADKWADPTRVYVNFADGDKQLPTAPILRRVLGNGWHTDRVDDDRETLKWTQDSESWTVKDCTLDFVQGLIASSLFEFEDGYWDGPIWGKFKESVGGKDAKFTLIFRANYIMARKK